MDEQQQNIQDAEIADSEVQLGQAETLNQFQNSHHNQVTQIFVDLVGRKQKQWNRRQASILKQVQANVAKRLVDALNNEVLIPLGMQEMREAVNRSPLKPLRTLTTQADTTPLKPEESILQVFCRKDVAGKLLILGEPGAGKTTTLLTLAEALIDEALKTPGTMIPIIFELSAWKDDRQLIGDWLVEQLKVLYNLSPQEGQQWLADRLLLPLLDGLDELGMERQQKCIAKINAFARNYPQVVVCCRVKEYRTAGARLGDLRGAVCLEPLTDEQIKGYLQSLQLEALWEAVQSSPEMGQMLQPDAEGKPGILRVPLLLNIAAETYEGKPFNSRAALYKAYVNKRLRRKTRREERNQVERQGRRMWAYTNLNQEPNRRQTQKTLRWVAQQLQENNTVELLIERIQPSWLELKARWRYRLVVELFGGLIVGLILGLIVGLFGGLVVGLTLGLIVGIDRINPVEAFKISMLPEVQRETLKILKKRMISGMIAGIIAGVVIGIILSLISGLIAGLISGLILGLILGLISGLFGGLISGLKRDLQLRSRLNQGIWNSLQSFLWTTLFSYPLGIIFTFAITDLPTIVAQGVNQGKSGAVILSTLGATFPKFIVTGIAGALLFGFLVGGGQACVQHLCLRLVLWQSGTAPWNLAQFLNYCVERRLLQRVGGRYRFLHRELLDYFAQLR